MVNKNACYLREVPPGKADISGLFHLLDIDFPRMARIPLVLLRASLKKGRLLAVLLTDGEQDYGYAVYQWAGEEGPMHVLYLAVLPAYRRCGLGGVLLARLAALSPGGILLDAEDPRYAKTPAAKQACEKRLAFYAREGFRLCPDFRFVNFGYHLRVLYSKPFRQADWLAYYRRLYNNAYGLPVSGLLIQPYQ